MGACDLDNKVTMDMVHLQAKVDMLKGFIFILLQNKMNLFVRAYGTHIGSSAGDGFP